MGNRIKHNIKKFALSFLCATVVLEGVATSSMQVLAYDDETALFDVEEEILLDTDEEIVEEEAVEDETVEDEAAFQESGRCGDGVNWGLDLTTGELNIFGEGAMEDNIQYSTYWYPVRAFIRKVVIKEGITYIGYEAFYAEGHLEQLEIASTVKSIGKRAFASVKLKEAESYELTDGIENIGDQAFENSYLADDVVIPASVKTVGAAAFSGLQRVKKLVFLGDMPEFGAKALNGNDCIIYYPADNETWTAEKVKALAEENQADIRAIGAEFALSGKCGDNITWEITGDEEKTLVLSGSGDMYDYSFADKAPWFVYRDEINKIEIDPEITSIGAYSFYRMNFGGASDEDEPFEFPKNLKSIGEYAFDLAIFSNREFTLPETVEMLGNSALAISNGVKVVSFLGNRPEFGKQVFSRSSNAVAHYPADNETWADFNPKDYDFGASNMTFTAMNKCVVTFVDPYGKEIPVSCYEGLPVSGPEVTLNEGDEILGWYRDNTSDPGFQLKEYRWNFSYNISKDMKLTARLKGTDCKLRFVTNCDTKLPDQIIKAGEKVTEPTGLSKEGYELAGWRSHRIGLSNDIYDFDTGLEDDLILYAIWKKPQSVSAYAIADYAVYTGKPVCPEVKVEIDGQPLEKDKDYTIKYSDNVKVGEGKYTVTLKGNYTGKITGEFFIVAVNIEDNPNVWVADEVVTIPYDGKKHSAKTTVKANLGGKVVTLKENVDYEYYYNFDEEDYIQPGINDVYIQGKGNFKGEISFRQVITTDVLLSKTTAVKTKAFPYTGKEVKPAITLKHKNSELRENVSYTVSYENNIEAGTATAVFQAIPGSGFAGSKRVTFEIAGTPIAKATVSGLEAKTYDGKEKTLEGLKVSVKGSDKKVTELKGMEESKYLEIKGTEAAAEVDYIYRYENNVNAGKGSVVLTGVNGCQGTVTKTFVIAPKEAGDSITATVSETAAFDKAGAKPEIAVTYKNGDTQTALVEGTDYTVKLGGNKKLGKSKAKATIVFKGNFKGKIVKEFEVVKADIAGFTATAEDVMVSAKAGVNAPVITVTDKAGNKLAAGKDFDKKVVCKYADTDKEVAAEDVVAAGTKLYAEVTGIGAYQGTLRTSEFRVVSKTIASAKVTAEAKYYNNKGVTLEKKDIKVVVGKDVLTEDDFDIVGYENNNKVGKATVILKGKGNYGGTVKATFVIKSVMLNH